MWATREASRGLSQERKAARQSKVKELAKPWAFVRDSAVSQFAASDGKSTPKGGRGSTKGSSCSSRRRAYLTDSPVPPSIVVKQCGGLAAFRFCVRVYQSFLSIRRAIRASLVRRLGDSRGHEKRRKRKEGQEAGPEKATSVERGIQEVARLKVARVASVARLGS
jgi:hypothetical protein